MSQNKHHYKIEITWKEGRMGIMSSPALNEKIEVATPPQFPGGVEGKWSPEHLFGASLGSCFMTTFTAIAEYSKLAFENLEIKVDCKLDKVDGKLMVAEIVLKPELIITEEKHVDKARRIMEKAESACLITRSVKSEIIFEPKVTIGATN